MIKEKKLQRRILLPAKFSLRFDGEIRSFTDKQKLKRIQHHQASFTTNTKGTSLGRKHKRRKRSPQNKPKTIKKMVIRSYISIITLNVNGLNAPTKRHRLAGWMKTCMPVVNMYALPLTTSFCLTPQNCMQLFYIVRFIMFPLWLTIALCFIFAWLLIVKSYKHLLPL